MSSSGIHRPEYATLPSGPVHSRHLQSQSFAIAHDKTSIAKLQIDKMGYFALAIWDEIMAQKAVKSQVVADFLVDHLVSGSSKLYDGLSDEVVEVCRTYAPSEKQSLAAILWRCIKNGF